MSVCCLQTPPMLSKCADMPRLKKDQASRFASEMSFLFLFLFYENYASIFVFQF